MEFSNNNILVDYNMIVDTDIGLYYLLKEKYNNPDFINTEILSLDKPGAIIKLMAEREEYNPLYMFLKEDYKENADNLYLELLNKESEYINNHANVYKTYNMFCAFLLTNLIRVDVMCRNEYEETIIKKLFRKANRHKYNIIKYDILEEIDLSNYNAIYIKRFKDVLRFNNLYKKNIYISSYKFNLESKFKSDIFKDVIKERMPDMDICLLVGKTNKIDIIKMY